MPLTPLHLAAGLPARRHVSMKAFILVNVLIDLEPMSIVFFGMDRLGYALHQGVHTLGGVTLMAIVTLLAGLAGRGKWRSWMSGACLGAYSHVLLDALVHHDVEPFAPLWPGNPLFLDIHAEVSLACAAILSIYLAKWVESLRVAERWARFRSRSG